MDSLLTSFGEFTYVSYWILLVVAFLEATPVIGSFVPGIFLVVAAGTAAAHGYFSLPALFIAVYIGALLGDIASYFIGRSSHSFLFRESLMGPSSPLIRAERFFEKYGGASVFFSHFFGPLRSFVPLTAGLSRMRVGPFLFWACLGAFVWAGAMIATGYFVGSYITVIASFISLYSVQITIITVLSLLLILSASRMINAARYIPNLFRSTLLWISQTKIARNSRLILPALLWVLRRFHVHRFSGLPLTVLVVIGLGILTSATGIMEQMITSETVMRFDADVIGLLGFFDSTFSVVLALAFTALGEPASVGIISAIVLLVLLNKSRFHSAIAFVVVLASTEATILITKILVERIRPEHSLLNSPLETFAFPSAHAAIAVALFGYIAIIAMRAYPRKRSRTLILAIAFVLILGVGTSRIVLSVHYPSDVIVGYVIGALWLAFTLSLESYASLRGATSKLSQIAPQAALEE